MIRITPPRCEECGQEPHECPTCGDFCCGCPAPWTALLQKKQRRLMPRAHYDKHGNPYEAKFIDGYTHTGYPDEAEDTKFLIENGWT